MLLSFRVENHRSIRDEQALTLLAGTDGSNPIEAPLAVGAIYGANASGKSNVLAALSFMREAVVDSHRLWVPDRGVPITPFAWGPKATEPSLFEAVFKVADIRYEYGFVASHEAFVEEWLHVYPTHRKQVWFERDGSDFKFGDSLKGENKVVERLTRPNSLFLSAAAQNHHELLAPVFGWFSSIESRRRFRRGAPLRGVANSPFGMDGEPSPEFLELLRAADTGIVDVKLTEDGVTVLHQSDSSNAWLPLEEESHGTQQLFATGPLLLRALEEGQLVLVDELEASLHPLLALELVRMFEDSVRNLHHAQLLFTTHDTNLIGNTLGSPGLRREQVWLTEKDAEGATRLYPLTDYKPRKEENLERGYLQGRYGAIPLLADFAAFGKTRRASNAERKRRG